MKENPALSSPLHPSYHFTKAEVVWMVKFEMARTVEDVLARRMRLLFLDAVGAITLAPAVAEVMAIALKKNRKWIEDQLFEFNKLAKAYLLYEVFIPNKQAEEVL
jgi:glycerol-3-phosphate dehydrogenase